MKSGQQMEGLADEGTDSSFLLCRVARESDLPEIMEIVRRENIASMVADEMFQAKRISKSLDTLNGRRSWSDGQLTLATELCGHSKWGETFAIVGSAGLNSCGGGYWAKKSRKPSGDIGGEGDYLVFESFANAGPSFEFSGTCVASAHRNKSVGTLHTVARIVFLLMHQQRIEADVGRIAFLCANLLPPPNEDNRFPFYEKFVKPLLGDIDYANADNGRYNDPAFFEPLLAGKNGDGPGARLSLLDVEAAIGANFAAVRNQTKGAERALVNCGFREVPKYDALDAGRYVEATLDDLKSNAKPRSLNARPMKANELSRQNGAVRCYFAPVRSMVEFFCVQAFVRQEGNTLLVPRHIFHRLGLNSEEQVIAVASDASYNL
jgi:arginine/ornithine N-succinyltransferase beta subunit